MTPETERERIEDIIEHEVWHTLPSANIKEFVITKAQIFDLLIKTRNMAIDLTIAFRDEELEGKIQKRINKLEKEKNELEEKYRQTYVQYHGRHEVRSKEDMKRCNIKIKIEELQSLLSDSETKSTENGI